MAIVIPGSLCRLCQHPLDEDDAVVVFPPFVMNRLDPLHLFNDCACHRRCFQAHELAGEADARLRAHQEAHTPGKRVCASCGQPIGDTADHFTTGHMTGDPEHPLHAYNHVHLHRSHLHEWEAFAEFRRLVITLQSSPEWDGPRFGRDY